MRRSCLLLAAGLLALLLVELGDLLSATVCYCVTGGGWGHNGRKQADVASPIGTDHPHPHPNIPHTLRAERGVESNYYN